MIFVCVQPASRYYAWQVDTMLYSFKKLNLFRKNQAHIICAEHSESDYFKRLINKYPEAQFFFYNDMRKNPQYISSIRFNLLEQHWKKYSYLEDARFFYHDCDIVLNRIPKIPNDRKIYLSDTKSYIGLEYIKSKGVEYVNLMSDIAGIDKETLKEFDQGAGGAQYVFSGIDWYFWNEAYRDSEKLFVEVSKLNNKKVNSDKNFHPLQIWTSDMWAILWNFWKRNKRTYILKELDFCWSTDAIERWDFTNICHNAGVSKNDQDLFFKGKYMTIKPPKGLKINNKKVSHKYYQTVCEAIYN